jgi:hypothetical protein
MVMIHWIRPLTLRMESTRSPKSSTSAS